MVRNGCNICIAGLVVGLATPLSGEHIISFKNLPFLTIIEKSVFFRALRGHQLV
jgi:hypothetical protein